MALPTVCTCEYERAGEPVFEHDFTNKDMVKEIYEGPCGKERFELELAARLAVRI